MKKKILSLLCTVVLLFGLAPTGLALENDSLRAADMLATLHLIADREYHLSAPVTRAEAAVLLVRVAGSEQAAKNASFPTAFRDVPDWAQDAVNYAAQQSWVTGVTNQEFKPNQIISANAWCTFLLRILGYSDKSGDFTVSDAAAFALRIGVVPREYSGLLTHADIYESLLHALTCSYRSSPVRVIDKLVESGACSRTSANALGLLNTRLTARQITDHYMSAVFCMDLYATQEAFYDKEATSQASGFFISPDGLAVTNYHSIHEAIYATATTVDGSCYPIERVIYYDPDIDIAVIRVSKTSLTHKKTSAFACMEMVGTTDIRAGDIVYTLGNPLGLGLAVSSGIIGAPARKVDAYSLPCVMNTADISQGSSGGALLNEFGRVIAVTTGAYTYGNNMYLAVPVDPVMDTDLTVEGWTLKTVAEREAER